MQVDAGNRSVLDPAQGGAKDLYGAVAAGDTLIWRTLGALIAAAVSGVLYAVAVSPATSSSVAFVCLVPLLIATRWTGTIATAVAGLIFAYISHILISKWVLNVTGLELYHLLLGLGYLSIYPIIWCLGLRYFRHDNQLFHALSVVSLWIVLEYTRNNAGFLGLSWMSLAHSVHDNSILLQSASAFGEYGITFVIVMTNCLLASLIIALMFRKKLKFYTAQAIVTVALLLAMYLYGVWRLGMEVDSKPMTIAAVNSSDSTIAKTSPLANLQSYNLLASLTESQLKQQTDLVVWPEGSFVLFDQYSQLIGQIYSLAQRQNTAIVFGSSAGGKQARRTDDPGDIKLENRLTLIDPNVEGLQVYTKRILVPFGEYVPLKGIVPWPAWMIPDLAEFKSMPSADNLTLGSNISLVPVICWENLYSKEFMDRVPQGLAIGVNISDLSIFKSRQAVLQHNMSSVFRAVESGIPVVVATNTGPSQLISATGQIIETGEFGKQGVIRATMDVRAERTLYWHIGDLLVVMAAVMLIVSIIRVSVNR